MNVVHTYCSENYSELFLKFFFPSWKRVLKNVRFVIYTDGWVGSNECGIEYIPFFPKSNDWSINTGRRYVALQDYLKKVRILKEIYNITFLDVDCFVVRDFFHVFEKDFDIGVTRLNSPRNKTASAGMVFFKNRGLEFVEDCLNRAKINKSKGIGMRAHRTSYMQKGFDTICKSGKFNIKNFSDDIYNSERDNLKEWYTSISKTKDKICILHFKGGRGSNPKVVQSVFNSILT